MSRHLFNLLVILTILFQLPISLFESVIDIVDGAVSTYYLRNQPQFSMVYTLIDYRNDVIKWSKLKWNHEKQVSGFTAKFGTFYVIISMVYKSVDHGKLWLICFLQ